MKKIPQIQPWIDDSELLYLKKAIDSTYVTEHELTAEFERRICELTGSKHAVAMCNGTAALYCCLKSLGIGEGDEVIVPNITFVATANAVLMAGATPVLCDLEKSSLSIDLTKAHFCLTDKTKAIIPVHLYGFSSKMDTILGFAKKHDIKVIEDAAQGVGVFYDGQHTGTFGEMGVLSFYGNKTITCGEGGVVLTDDDDLRDACYRLKNHGRLSKGSFVHRFIGFNFCFTEMQAAVGLSQLDKLPLIRKKKKQIYDRYVAGFNTINSLLEPLRTCDKTDPMYWFSSFLTYHKTSLMKYLDDKGIQTREFFYPLHLQPCYNGEVKAAGSFESSKMLSACGISLPSSFELSEEDQQYVIDNVNEFCEEMSMSAV